MRPSYFLAMLILILISYVYVVKLGNYIFMWVDSVARFKNENNKICFVIWVYNTYCLSLKK